MRWSTSPRRKRIRPRFQLLFLGNEGHVASSCLFRSVQFPCRLFLQAIDSSWLCRLCMEHYIKLRALFLVIYDIVLILSEVAHALREQRSRRTPKPSIDPYPPDLSAHHSGVAFIVVCPSSPLPKHCHPERSEGPPHLHLLLFVLLCRAPKNRHPERSCSRTL